MSLPLTVCCFSKIQIGFAFLVPAHPGSPGQRAVKRVCVIVLYCVRGHIFGNTRPIFIKFFCVCYLWPWLDPAITAQ